jgi:hypothetical protein
MAAPTGEQAEEDRGGDLGDAGFLADHSVKRSERRSAPGRRALAVERAP